MEITTILKVANDEKYYQDAVKRIASLANKAVLLEMAQELAKEVPGPYRLVCGEKEVPNPEYYIAPKKVYAYKTEDLVNFIALFFHHMDNMALYWTKVPQIYKDLILHLTKQKYLAAKEAKIYGFGSIVSIVESHRSYEGDEAVVADHKVWFSVEKLFKLDEEYLVPMLMPHIKGFKARELGYRSLNSRVALKEYFLEIKQGEWIILDSVIKWLAINSYTYLTKRMIRDMRLEDPVYGGGVTLDRIVAFERSALGSLCAALYGLGMAELALSPIPEVCYDPYLHICAVRLTELGRYAFGIEKKYEVAPVVKENLFELDENRLIIRSIIPGNPYESLLTDTSASIGGGRYLMSPESFLRNCKTRQDVEEKVDFFHQYICAEPPAVWTDFFKTIEHRCKPFKSAKEPYEIYIVDPSDNYLISLLTTDSELKSMVIRAEGFRILVPHSKRSAFVSRLKSYGYLV